MGNTHAKPHPRPRNKKQVHWKAADRPSPPGRPRLSESELSPELVTIVWAKPVRDGGSPITGYLVEHRRIGASHWTRTTPLLVPFPELVLTGLEPGWRYQFRIRAENVVGLSDFSEISEPLTVTLQKFAITSPKFTEELKDVTVLENDKVEFVVHFLGQPPPKICWYKDGFEIFSSRRTRILTENDKSVLTIHQSALGDEGEIKCAATNKAGHASTKARLTLEAPPTIRLPRQYEDGVLFEIGEVVRLKVSVAGRPTPLVFWSHDGETIQNDDRYEIEYVDRCSVLKVGEARRGDRGEYRIKAVNKIGQDVASFLVTITDKPSRPGRARVVMTLGKSVTLSWATPEDDGGCKIGNYIVEYYRLGWNVWLKAATSRQLTTILGDLIEGSEYKFRVKAESPYGVSEPSEESDIVFIPDHKRGITSPQARSRSQPKDLIDEIAPIASRRKKPRSQSTTTKADAMTNMYDEVPKRPERSKIKSPPKTPEQSPHVLRKELNAQTLIDRASIARELAYGSPEIKIKKTEQDLPQQNHTRGLPPSPSPIPRTPSPSRQAPSPTLILAPSREKSKSPSPKEKTPSPKNKTPSPREKSPNPKDKTPSPKDRRGFLQQKSDALEESSEFMLVLYPDSNTKGPRRSFQNLEFDFDDYDIPPPLSLSAPELGAEPPLFENLKTSASSTELLHERAMIRFNEAIAAEEEELKRRRRSSYDGGRTVEIPKIQINSKDDQDIVGLERKPSRRRSSGGVAQQQLLWAQRRFSLKSSNEFGDLADDKVQKVIPPSPEPPKKEMVRQRSESEEKEEEEFAKVRVKMAIQGQSSFEKKSIDVVDENKWMEDYEESLSESETASSEDDRDYEEKPPPPRVYSDEDDDTYHPGFLKTKNPTKDEPFEILTKRNKLPDPNFVPKPILKRTEDKIEAVKEVKEAPRDAPQPKTRSHSPMPQSRQPQEIVRGRSQSLAQPPSANKFFQRSSSLSAPEEIKPEILKPSMNVAPGQNITAVATLCGITAASIVIPEELLRKKKDEEEAKVVVDHYMDIVKHYGHRKKSVPQVLNPNWKISEESRKSWSSVEDREDAKSQQTWKKVEETSKPVQQPWKTAEEAPKQVQQPWKTSEEAPKQVQQPWKAIEDAPKQMQQPWKTIEEEPLNYVEQPWKTTEETPRQQPWETIEEPTRLVQQPWKTTEEATKPTQSSKNEDNEQWKSFEEKEQLQKTMTEEPPPKEIKQLQRLRRESTPQRSDRSPSPSPSPHRGSPVQQRGRSLNQKHRKTSSRPKTPSKSPPRLENWSGRSQRKSSPSPMKVKATPRRTPSPSPVPLAKPKPKLKEIMTQTSIGLELNYSSDSRTSTPNERRQEELLAKAEVKVRSFVDYVTDLAMFAVACWLYLFSNELLAIPVLLIMVYRQLKDEIGKRIPRWIVRRFNKTKTKKS